MTQKKRFLFFIMFTTTFFSFQSSEGSESSFTQGLPIARKWYQKATDQGLALAQYIFGRIYKDGIGVTQNSEIYSSGYDFRICPANNVEVFGQ